MRTGFRVAVDARHLFSTEACLIRLVASARRRLEGRTTFFIKRGSGAKEGVEGNKKGGIIQEDLENADPWEEKTS